MSREEFIRQFRGPMQLFLVESWMCRKEPMDKLGQLMEEHRVKTERLLERMADAAGLEKNAPSILPLTTERQAT